MKLIRQGSLLGIFALLALSLTVAPAQERVKDARVQKVLSQARVALGGEAKLNAVKSLSVSFKFRRINARGEQDTGETQLDFLLPDKFTGNESVNFSGNAGQVFKISFLNGDQAEFDVRTSTPEIPVINTGTGGADEQAALHQKLRKQFTSYLLQLLLTTPASFPVEFTYAGEAQAEEVAADALDVKGAGNFSARLFFDKQTHRLLLMSYREPGAQQIAFTASKDKKKLIQSQQQTSAHTTSAPPEVGVQLRFSDYRAEDGILVPHLITRERNGKLDQEMELNSFKVNLPFKPEHFEIKRKK